MDLSYFLLDAVTSSCEHSGQSSVSTKRRKFLDELSCQILKEDPVSRNWLVNWFISSYLVIYLLPQRNTGQISVIRAADFTIVYFELSSDNYSQMKVI